MLYLNTFKNKKEVHYLVTDMNKVYKDLAVQYFPNATIVIDKFNVVRYATWALENVRTNNAIKVIKRNAFGYRNFRNFRNRIFLALT